MLLDQESESEEHLHVSFDVDGRLGFRRLVSGAAAGSGVEGEEV